MLLDIHGQHFHQSLGRRSIQLELLDHFGGLLEQTARTESAFADWRTIATQLRLLRDADAESASRLDLLAFQLRELDALGISSSELETLASERQKLQNSGKLAAGVATALHVLVDHDSSNVNSLIADATNALTTLADFDAELGPILEFLHSANIQVAEATESLRRYSANLEMDPQRRDWVEERLDAVQTVARKHRVGGDELPLLADKLRHEHDLLCSAEQRGQDLEQAADEAQAVYRKQAKSLSKGRGAAARKFATAVTNAMGGLGMPNGVFDVSLVALGDDAACAQGIDRIDFLISANPGQPLQPLAKIASGGELSRMSLAIQVIASDGSEIPTMIFDEVDSGVGGGVAEMVGRRLQQLGSKRQILCVTHLPQVASLADQHFRVSKVSDGKSTRTRLQVLGNDERIDELARMLGGVEITQKTLAHAAEMLAGAPQKSA
jgi:DNA repair protein RecN (Recombination protein N)